MKPYPFELLNHLTVPCTYMLLLMETWMFLTADKIGTTQPPPAINCAECSRMRHSVKRTFVFLCVRKYTHIRLQKRFKIKNREFFQEEGRSAQFCNFKRTQGLRIFVSHRESFVSRVQSLEHDEITNHRLAALNSSSGEESRKDCCTRRSKGADAQEPRWLRCPRTSLTYSRIPDFA